MFERARHYYRKINRPRVPEGSRVYRAAVLVAVVTSVLTATRYSGMNPLSSILILVGVIGGSVYSYYSRNKSNLFLKFLLTLALIGVFALSLLLLFLQPMGLLH